MEAPPKDRRYEWLLDDLCVRLGWCGSVVDEKPSHVSDFIPEGGPVTAAQFADWVIRADGLDPHGRLSRQRQWREQIAAVFVKHMKADVVDASELKWVD